jgi:hypothetical protein
MKWTSFLGWEVFWVLLPFLYLCVNRRIGAPLFFLYYLSFLVNDLVKVLVQWPRPYWIDDHVHALAKSASYGMPSGHAQMAVVGWCTAALLVKHRVAWPMVATVVLGVSFSRVYLGAHFVSDVVVGWILGALVLILYLRLEPKLSRWFRLRSFGLQVLAAAAATILLLLGLVATRFVPPRPDPALWAKFSLTSRSLVWVFQCSGGIFGSAVGLAMLNRYKGLVIREPIVLRLFALIYALGTIYLFREGYSWATDGKSEGWQFALAFVEFWLVSWVLTFHAPWALSEMHAAGAFAANAANPKRKQAGLRTNALDCSR